MKALIFAAGKGTRLKPFTDHHPKALAKVNGVTLLERNIKYLQRAGINDFVINIHHFGSQIMEFLFVNDNFGADIEISDESAELLETGGGLMFARRLLDHGGNFLVMNADILTELNIVEFINFHKANGELATLAVSDRSSSRKLLFDDNSLLKGWKNIQTGEVKLARSSGDSHNELAFSGIHVINPKIFDKIRRTGKFSIIDEYLDLMEDEKILGYVHTARLVDVGKPEAISEAEKIFK